MIQNSKFIILIVIYIYLNGHDCQKVKLRDVEILTLEKGKITTGRRSSGIEQLKCTSGSRCTYYAPQVVQCYNRGFDGQDVNWECKAELDDRVKFGTLQVNCEGYDYQTDPYILAGSCGLEYSLEYTNYSSYFEDIETIVFLVIFITLILFVIIAAARTKRSKHSQIYDYTALPAPTPARSYRSRSYNSFTRIASGFSTTSRR